MTVRFFSLANWAGNAAVKPGKAHPEEEPVFLGGFGDDAGLESNMTIPL